MWIEKSLLSGEPLTLRLHTLLAHIAYLTGAYVFVRRFVVHLWRYAAFVLLTANVFLADYFVVARGYGMAVAATLWCLLLLGNWLNSDQKIKPLIWVFFFLDVAILSNYSFVFIGIALTAYLVLLFLLTKGKGYQKKNFRLFALMLTSQFVLFVFVTAMLLKVKNLGGFWEGGTEGFWSSTMASLVEASLYGASYSPNLMPVLMGLVATMYLAGTTLTFLAYRKLEWDSFLGALWVVLSLVAFGTILQWLIFESLLLLYRTAIMFLPLFFLFSIMVGIKLFQLLTLFWKKAFTVAINGTALLLLLHFGLQANNSSLFHSEHYASIEKAVRALESIIEQDKWNRPTAIAVDHQLVYGFNYYKIVRGIELWHFAAWKVSLEHDKATFYFDTVPTKNYDYFLLLEHYDTEGRVKKEVALQPLVVFPETGTYIAKKQ
jgi:hypothetical protein